MITPLQIPPPSRENGCTLSDAIFSFSGEVGGPYSGSFTDWEAQMRRITGWLTGLLLMAGGGAHAGGTPGEFDYYVLSLGWS